MLKRKIDKQLLAWKNNKDHKCLVVQGARQVGKTFSIREFGNSNYEELLEINFKKTPSAAQIFSGDLDVNSIIMAMRFRFPEYVHRDRRNARSRREIYLKGMWVITMKNPVAAPVQIIMDHIATTKDDKKLHGIGLINMENVAEKYNGMIKFANENSEFIVRAGLELL